MAPATTKQRHDSEWIYRWHKNYRFILDSETNLDDRLKHYNGSFNGGIYSTISRHKKNNL